MSPAPLCPPPHPSATRSSWVRMRSDDAPREGNDSKAQDTLVLSWLLGQNNPQSLRAPAHPPAGTCPSSRPLRSSEEKPPTVGTPCHKQSLHRATCPWRKSRQGHRRRYLVL